MMIFYSLHLDWEISNLSCVYWVCFGLHLLLTFPHATKTDKTGYFIQIKTFWVKKCDLD